MVSHGRSIGKASQPEGQRLLGLKTTATENGRVRRSVTSRKAQIYVFRRLPIRPKIELRRRFERAIERDERADSNHV